eukprot:1459092-Prymnesium_polylepis.1
MVETVGQNGTAVGSSASRFCATAGGSSGSWDARATRSALSVHPSMDTPARRSSSRSSRTERPSIAGCPAGEPGDSRAASVG